MILSHAFSLPRALLSPRAQYPCPHSHLQGKACFSVLVIHSRAIPMSVSTPAFVQGRNFGNKKGDWDLDHRKFECLPTCWVIPPLLLTWSRFWKGAAVDLMASMEGLTLGDSNAHSVGSWVYSCILIATWTNLILEVLFSNEWQHRTPAPSEAWFLSSSVCMFPVSALFGDSMQSSNCPWA